MRHAELHELLKRHVKTNAQIFKEFNDSYKIWDDMCDNRYGRVMKPFTKKQIEIIKQINGEYVGTPISKDSPYFSFCNGFVSVTPEATEVRFME